MQHSVKTWKRQMSRKLCNLGTLCTVIFFSTLHWSPCLQNLQSTPMRAGDDNFQWLVCFQRCCPNYRERRLPSLLDGFRGRVVARPDWTSLLRHNAVLWTSHCHERKYFSFAKRSQENQRFPHCCSCPQKETRRGTNTEQTHTHKMHARPVRTDWWRCQRNEGVCVCACVTSTSPTQADARPSPAAAIRPVDAWSESQLAVASRTAYSNNFLEYGCCFSMLLLFNFLSSTFFLHLL